MRSRFDCCSTAACLAVCTPLGRFVENEKTRGGCDRDTNGLYIKMKERESEIGAQRGQSCDTVETRSRIKRKKDPNQMIAVTRFQFGDGPMALQAHSRDTDTHFEQNKSGTAILSSQTFRLTCVWQPTGSDDQAAVCIERATVGTW